MIREHVLASGKVHHQWDRSLAPAIEINPGDVVHFEAEEVSGGQVTPGCPASALAADSDRLYPLAGPVFIRGAEPGDALEIEIRDLRPGPWGWAGLVPGLGLLAEDFPEPYIKHFDLRNGRYAEFGPGIRVPIRPFCGTMGVAPSDPGPHPALPPTQGAGNIDTRHLTAGTILRLPVLVPGAMFSAGDCHAAQGDGEVCVTGLECPMMFSLRFNVTKKAGIGPWRYQFWTPPGSLQPESDTHGYLACAALGPDLMENARNAIRDLIQWLATEHKLSREDAYVLCSLAADLKISQIVDRPNWGVSAYLALSIFGSR
jgi:acetamidase/formamidase